MAYPSQASLPASLIVGGKKNSLSLRMKNLTDPRLLRMLHHRENFSSQVEKAGSSEYCLPYTSKAWTSLHFPGLWCAFSYRGVQTAQIAHPCVQPGALSWADLAMQPSDTPTEEKDVFSLPCTLQKRWVNLLNANRFCISSFAGSSLIIFRMPV